MAIRDGLLGNPVLSGLLARGGPVAIQQAANQQIARMQQKPQAARLRAPGAINLPPDNSVGQGLSQLGKALGDIADMKEQGAAKKDLADLYGQTTTVQEPGTGQTVSIPRKVTSGDIYKLMGKYINNPTIQKSLGLQAQRLGSEEREQRGYEQTAMLLNKRLGSSEKIADQSNKTKLTIAENNLTEEQKSLTRKLNAKTEELKLKNKFNVGLENLKFGNKEKLQSNLLGNKLLMQDIKLASEAEQNALNNLNSFQMQEERFENQAKLQNQKLENQSLLQDQRLASKESEGALNRLNKYEIAQINKTAENNGLKSTNQGIYSEGKLVGNLFNSKQGPFVFDTQDGKFVSLEAIAKKYPGYQQMPSRETGPSETEKSNVAKATQAVGTAEAEVKTISNIVRLVRENADNVGFAGDIKASLVNVGGILQDIVGENKFTEFGVALVGGQRDKDFLNNLDSRSEKLKEAMLRLRQRAKGRAATANEIKEITALTNLRQWAGSEKLTANIEEIERRLKEDLEIINKGNKAGGLIPSPPTRGTFTWTKK